MKIQRNKKKKRTNIKKKGKREFLKQHVRNKRKSPIQAALEFPNCTRAKDTPPPCVCLVKQLLNLHSLCNSNLPKLFAAHMQTTFSTVL